MKKAYTICFMVTGGIDIEAENADEARGIFDDMDAKELAKILSENDVTITEVLESEDGIEYHAADSNISHTENLRLCPHCLLGLESREGVQPVIHISIDPDELEMKCDWCGETAEEGGFDELFELI